MAAEDKDKECNPEDDREDTRELLLDIKGCTVSFTQYDKGFDRKKLTVIRDLHVSVHEGEIVAVIGSSGSGKSLLAHGILGILPYNARMDKTVMYRGAPLTQERSEALRGREIVLVPQSVDFLDPLMKIGTQIRKGKKDRLLREKNDAIFDRFHLKREVQDLYPFELSGGMTRRVLISTALIESPKLILADEPTPGLDGHTAMRVMSHFRELADMGAGVLVITHDLELAVKTADRIVVFYAGTTVEDAAAEDFRQEETLRHPYSRALWRAIPGNGFQAVKGTQPYAEQMPEGCPYGPRCEAYEEACGRDIPWRACRDGYVRCISRGET